MRIRIVGVEREFRPVEFCQFLRMACALNIKQGKDVVDSVVRGDGVILDFGEEFVDDLTSQRVRFEYLE